MSQTSTRLALPYIQPAQAQKHVTHNEAIELLDMIVQLTLQDVDTNTPPASPSEGETWALGPAPTGAWADQGGALADMRLYDGVNWVGLGGGSVSFDNLPGVGVNATADTTNRLSVSADATLLNHAGGGHQIKINKSGVGDTASLLYQTGFAGRAEMGLAGTDDFAVKVSNGGPWFTGLTVLAASGAVQINEVLSLPPRATPASATAGDVYFDSTTSKLRCFDGSAWQDLF